MLVGLIQWKTQIEHKSWVRGKFTSWVLSWTLVFSCPWIGTCTLSSSGSQAFGLGLELHHWFFWVSSFLTADLRGLSVSIIVWTNSLKISLTFCLVSKARISKIFYRVPAHLIVTPLLWYLLSNRIDGFYSCFIIFKSTFWSQLNSLEMDTWLQVGLSHYLSQEFETGPEKEGESIVSYLVASI